MKSNLQKINSTYSIYTHNQLSPSNERCLGRWMLMTFPPRDAGLDRSSCSLLSRRRTTPKPKISGEEPSLTPFVRLYSKRKLENRSMPPASAERARDKDAHIPASSPVLLGLPPAPSAASLDPFMSLAADSHRLQELLSLRRFWHDDETNAGQSVEGSLRLTEIYDSVPSHCQAVHRACRQHCR